MPSDNLKEIDDFHALFLNDVPLLDVRAPVEFAEGAFPTAENHPLIGDIERHEIGITYKEQGQDRAIELGEQMVSGTVQQERIDAWRGFLERHPDAVLYCFRGGMRSKITQRWLQEQAGIDCPRVRGGYKAMRRFLLEQLEHNSPISHPVVVGGRTGVGKTRLLIQSTPAIDLEGMAHHRGSAFGHHPQPQPAQIDFENAMSIALLKQVSAGNSPFLVEDESRNIGSRHIPPVFYQRLEKAPLILLEATLEERISITLQEYVHDSLAAFQREHSDADEGFAAWSGYLQTAVDRIQRRLGGERHKIVKSQLLDALQAHAASGDTSAHRAWIGTLLAQYYDGMYEYQLSKKLDRISFSGDRTAVFEFLLERYDIQRIRVND